MLCGFMCLTRIIGFDNDKENKGKSSWVSSNKEKGLK